MAYTNTPQFSTYQNKRIAFIQNENLRNATTNRDVHLINVFGEAIETDTTKQKFITIRSRGGLEETIPFGGTKAPRGFFERHWKGNWYYVVDNELHKYDGNTDTVIFTLPSSSGPVGFTDYSSTTEDLLFFCDGQNGWNLKTDGTVVSIIPDVWQPGTTYAFGDRVRPSASSDFWYTCVTAGTSDPTEPVWPTTIDDTIIDGTVEWKTIGGNFPVPHIPMPVYIDGYLVLAKAGTQDFYNSELEDPWNWPLDGFLSAEMYPDNLVALCKYNNYILAGGEDTIEFFYDAAHETGSPFERNESAIATIGIAAPHTLLQTDRQVIFVGQTADGGKTVWKITDFKPEEIGIPPVRESLTAEDGNIVNIRAYMVRHKGHKFYVLRLSSRTWVYDFDENLWHEWMVGTFNWPGYLASDNNVGDSFILTPEGVYTLKNELNQDLGSIPIVREWTTDSLDFDSINRKAMIRLAVVGNMPFNGTIDVSWSDDDYATWSTPRALNCNLQRPALVNGGIFRRRAFKFMNTDNVELRLIGLELVFNIHTS